jgi:hypothetical protein
MKNIFTKANLFKALGHLKDNAFRYTIATSVVSLMGWAATDTDKVSQGILTGVTMLEMILQGILG